MHIPGLPVQLSHDYRSKYWTNIQQILVKYSTDIGQNFVKYKLIFVKYKANIGQILADLAK